MADLEKRILRSVAQSVYGALSALIGGGAVTIGLKSSNPTLGWGIFLVGLLLLVPTIIIVESYMDCKYED